MTQPSLKAIGNDTRIGPYAHVSYPEEVSIGMHSAIDAGFYCTTRAVIGDYVHIGPYVTVIGGRQSSLSLGHFSNIAAGGRIICGSDEYLGYGLIGPNSIPEKFRDRRVYSDVIIERFANLGTNVVVHPGVTVGEGAVVGSCSLVLTDLEPWTVYVGIPCRPVKARPSTEMLRKAREMGY